MYKKLEIYKTLSILCVDDEADIRNIYKTLFSLLFKEVHIAKNGEEGLEIFQKRDVDIILTEHSMPLLSGLDMIEKIRSVDPHVPIIMITELESLDILTKALNLGINGFIYKPVSAKSIFSTLEFVAKSVVADRLFMKCQEEKLFYNLYQEKLTYKKENAIIRNDLSEKKNAKCLDYFCEVVFKPKDILCGDSYSIREISDDEYVVFLIDGMGKGISASVTAMLGTAFVNYHIDKAVSQNRFSFHDLVEELLTFLAPNLLDDEVASCNFLHFDGRRKSLEYVMFSMPPVLYVREGSTKVEKIRSNNPPMAKYTQTFETSELDISDMQKMLIYSDGLNENGIGENDRYGNYLPQDFFESDSSGELEERRAKRVMQQDDDITYIFVNSK